MPPDSFSAFVPGDRAEIVSSTRLAPGSSIRLEAGDHVTIERVGSKGCVVRVVGSQLAAVPLHALRLVSRRQGAERDPVLDLLRDMKPRI
jgi:hypothetical protein